MINKYLKSIALTAFFTVATFGIFSYTACNRDECKDVICQNEGTCYNGNCACLLGYIGDRCQFEVRLGYDSTYRGNGTNTDGEQFPKWALVFKPTGTAPTDMKLTLVDSNNIPQFLFTVKLVTNTTFTLDEKTIDSFTYTGNGTIRVDSASLFLKRTNNNPDPKTILNYTFKDMYRE